MKFSKEQCMQIFGVLLTIGGFVINYCTNQLSDMKMKEEIKKQVGLALKEGVKND